MNPLRTSFAVSGTPAGVIHFSPGVMDYVIELNSGTFTSDLTVRLQSSKARREQHVAKDELEFGDPTNDKTNFTGTLGAVGQTIFPHSLRIAAVDALGTTMTLEDDGAGAVIGDVGTGTNTINYATRAIDFDFIRPPSNPNRRIVVKYAVDFGAYGSTFRNDESNNYESSVVVVPNASVPASAGDVVFVRFSGVALVGAVKVTLVDGGGSANVNLYAMGRTVTDDLGRLPPKDV